MKHDPFYHDDFLMYSLAKLNESSRRKTRAGSPSLRGWNVYPKVKFIEFREALKDTQFDQKLSFKENYKLLHDKLLEVFDDILAVKY